MAIIIVDWEKHFENSQSKRWENLRWVPIPNKQGIGYKKIMQLKNGAEVFGCWIAIVECASRQKPRGIINMSTDDLSLETMINNVTLLKSIEFLCKLSWLIVDSEQTQSVLTPQNTSPADQRSILFNSIPCNSLKEEKEIEEIYSLYPTKDVNHDNQSTGKSSKNKQKIKKILESKYPLKKAIEFYLSECNRTKCYLKNYGTFLNNLPDVELLEDKQPEQQKPKPTTDLKKSIEQMDAFFESNRKNRQQNSCPEGYELCE